MVWGLIVFAAFVQAVFMALMVNAMGSMSGGATLFVLSSQFLKEKLNLKVFIGIIVALFGGLLCISGTVGGGSFGLDLI